MRIIAKSIIREENLKGKSKICRNIEIQLFDEFDRQESVKELYAKTISIPNVRILAVHSPIVNNEGVNIEFIGNDDDYKRIAKTIELAHMFSEYYNERIKVIIHSALDIELLTKIPDIYNNILRFFGVMLAKYPNVDFCIENVIPVNKSKTDEIYMRSNCLFDGIELVNKLNEIFKTDRFGTVLDTCHALTTIRGLQNYFKDYPEITKQFSLEDFFVKNKDCVKLIHLANVINLGYDKGTHGILFKDDDLPLMQEILGYYKKYDYNCDITIEISENDYVLNENFKDNYNKLLNICKDENILIEQ